MTGRLERTAERVLALAPDPAPRVRLLREVLGRRVAVTASDASRHVTALRRAQRPNGGFGWLHRADVDCTEGAVRRMNALGLPPRHPLCRSTAQHLAGLLDGSIRAPDRVERNDRWPTGFELFAAATLSRLHPTHHSLVAVKHKWRSILAGVFAEGTYDAARENAAHADVTGASDVADSYLRLDNKYSVQLLATTSLAPVLRRHYFDWLWSRAHLRYLLTPPAKPISAVPAARRAAWLTTQTALSAYPEWRRAFRSHAADLWQMRNASGLWDLGPRRAGDLEFPLSESWRLATARVVDWSVRCLVLLRRMDAT